MNKGAIDFDALTMSGHEDWRYTNLAPAIQIGKRWLAEGATLSPAEELSGAIDAVTSGIAANWIVIANGIIDESRFEKPPGLIVERFAERAASLDRDPLQELGNALLQQGVRLHINESLSTPLGILIIDASSGNAAVSQASVEIEIDENCSADIIEYQASQGIGDHYCNSSIELSAEANAAVSYVRIQDRQLQHVQTGDLNVQLGRDSRLKMASYDLGGKLIRNDVTIDIAATGAEAVFSGLYLARDGQHIDNHTRVDHRVGPAISKQHYRGILKGRCRCVWNGKAIVHAGADGTDAEQSNHNLLLSDDAEIDAKPELEIYAEDVKCSHGTTVGQLDDAALYYLRTRGLDQQSAQQLLTRAFAATLVQDTPVQACQETISVLVDERLALLIEDVQE